MDTTKRTSHLSPYLTANPLSRLCYWWLGDIFKKGHASDLSTADMYDPLPTDLSEPLGDDLEKNWSKEILDSAKNKKKPSLMRAISKTFLKSYMMWGIVICFHNVVIRNLQPFALAYLIAYFNPKSEQTVTEGYIHGVVTNAIALLSTIIYQHTMLGCMQIGMRVRVACCSLVYRKILRLNKSALGKTAAGHVINLMSNDVNRFDVASIFVHYLWVMPLQIPFAAYLMWESVGSATLAGLAVLLIQVGLVQSYLSRYQTIMRKKIALRTDERVKMMSEIVAGIQVIKMYAWEKPFEALVALARKIEMKLISKTSYIRGFSIALMVFTERAALYATIVAFVLAGNTLRADIVFSIAQYFNLLQLTVSIMFPYGLTMFGEARISVRRLEEFLLLEEKVTKGKLISNWTEKKAVEKRTDVVLNKARGSWQAEPIVDTLRNINITVKPGDFCAVVGPVGAGKSSLLQVFLGELPLSEGTMSLGGASLAYSSQEPWLFVATVRQNIIFGQPFDKDRYRQVVKACSLEKDFDQFPHGDMTLVGERGVSLSGGQRARINLARAVYRQADLYLMDDPLSAVDSHVGRHLVMECIEGFLRDKTRILVTHQLHHLKNADNIVILRNGQIEIQGTYDEVCTNPLFSELMSDEDETENPEKALQRKKSLSESKHENEGQLVPLDEDEDDDEENTEEKELMEKGGLSFSVYKKYFTSGGGIFLLTTTFLMILAAQAITSIGDLYLTAWSNNEEYLKAHQDNMTAALLDNLTPSSLIDANSTDDMSSLLPETNSPTVPTILGTFLDTVNVFENITVPQDNTTYTSNFHDTQTAIYVYSALIIACVVVTTIRSLMFFWVCMRASVKLHNTMFGNILQATMRFFDTNPSGRILNRFSKDMGSVDEMIPRLYVETVQVFMVGLGILMMVAIKSPYMMIVMLVIGFILYKMTILYLATAQDVKRLEGITRSPVFSHLTATLNGLSTIRACGAQEMLKKEFDKHQDVHSGAWYISIAANTAFGFWLSFFCCVFVIIVTFTFLIIGKDNTFAGDVGLAISQSLIMTGMLQHGIKQTTDVITQMTSVERVLQYTKLPKEVGLDSPPPPSNWPKKGRVEFKKAYLKYHEEGDPVLKDLNAIVESGWKVGIVGRTGAGKSSLISALFRLAIVDGVIKIDDVDTKDIKLQELRSKISIIPQEPMLFSASLRHNLDPFEQQSDAALWQALEDVELKQAVSSLSQMVSEGGGNFSAGQRQLLCLARAIVKNNNVLVLDEATANVDPKTDSLIQKTIRQKFAHCTVLTIAHRLNTVMDSDRVLVMDRGQMIEYDHPYKLMQDRDSQLSQMVTQLGTAAERNLMEVAREAYNKHIKFIEEPAD